MNRREIRNMAENTNNSAVLETEEELTNYKGQMRRTLLTSSGRPPVRLASPSLPKV